jgi:hypothetical protein
MLFLVVVTSKNLFRCTLTLSRNWGSTKEKPGLKYESMFLPDNELGYSCFDDEEKRLAALRNEFEI